VDVRVGGMAADVAADAFGSTGPRSRADTDAGYGAGLLAVTTCFGARSSRAGGTFKYNIC
jgi:hypothetical protein